MLEWLCHRWLEKLFLLLVLVMTGWFSTLLVKWLVSEKSLPLTELVIEGDREYVTDIELQKALSDIPQGGSFFTLDVALVQKKVESLPWVRQASVRKQWPNRLQLYLHEQHAAARWNETLFLNDQGELFDAPDLVEGWLVELDGPEHSEAKVLEAYLQLKQLLDPSGFEVEQLTLTPRHEWRLKLKNGMALIIGQQQMVERIERFTELYPYIDSDKQIAYLDLRYDTGIAVGWKP